MGKYSIGTIIHSSECQLYMTVYVQDYYWLSGKCYKALQSAWIDSTVFKVHELFWGMKNIYHNIKLPHVDAIQTNLSSQFKNLQIKVYKYETVIRPIKFI